MANRKLFFITMDVEEDLGLDAKTFEFKGITDGIPCFLDILDSFKIKGTFFATGEVGMKFPGLVREIDRSHELACHGLTHKLITDFDIAVNRKNLIQNVKIFKDLTGHAPYGFRAVNNVIDTNFMNLLEALNFKYDSSLLSDYPPIKKYIGFQEESPKYPYFPSPNNCRKKGGKKLVEMPISTLPIINFPWVGSWIRACGSLIYKLSSLSTCSYVMLTLHSWDFIDLTGKTPHSNRSGKVFLKIMKDLIQYFYSKEYLFLTTNDGCAAFE
jgi:peptidoglycan/xylan/chitin deacetylase (PgdA/CDA1 family)